MSNEKRVALNAEGLTLSRLVLGAWRLLSGPERPGATSVARLISEAIDLGMTSFDHADIYGDYGVEEVFGAGFKYWGGQREAIELITKCDIMLTSAARPDNRIKHYDTSAAHIKTSVDRSLKNLHTDYIDVLLIHRPDPLMDADETAAGLESVVTAGKVRAVGVSNFSPSQFDLLASRLPFPLVTNQIEMSVVHTASLFDGSLDHAQRLGYAPMIWSPLGGGSLFTGDGAQEKRVRETLKMIADEAGGVDISAIAIAWLLRHPARPIPVLGSLKRERLAAMAAALDIKLERQQWFGILKASTGQDVP
ncbi:MULTISPECIES: aldo/keto reductase [Phyllobacterium]|jgi:predicted oxidoreductase|uniref:Oxidoreductase n=1 Tax=Phyllobacterium sophorae TaxID=1520277 RepID=A0A2P7BD84_9HYPH|nr:MULTISPECIES: aldo/keto reductase [Phyllobacterium]PSH64418.1 oxidoreductase [Phyllobacterium sophorae]UXN64716.1 aldo/keto reductase [Phyllobacterium sp. A18/5-2]